MDGNHDIWHAYKGDPNGEWPHSYRAFGAAQGRGKGTISAGMLDFNAGKCFL